MAPVDAENAWDGADYDYRGSSFTLVEIPLDDEMINTLHRRSRRQLRNIQEASSAVLKLCRMRKVLTVNGTQDAIEFVRKQLQCLNGPRKQVPVAIWAELMRTRTLQLGEGASPPSQHGSIAGLQELTGCRIHIERSRCEVRMFGPQDAVAKATELIDALAHEVAEERVLVGGSAMPSAVQMQALGEKYGVMLLKDESVLVVLGLRTVTHNAAENLRRCLAGQEEWPDPVTSDEVFTDASLRCPEGFAYEAPVHIASTYPKPEYPKQHFGKGMSGNRSSRNDKQQWRMTEERAEPVQAVAAQEACSPPSTCPTCGAGRFCVGCGAVVFQNGGQWVWVGPDRCTGPTSPALQPMCQNEQVCAPQIAESGPKEVPCMPPIMYMNYDGTVVQQEPTGMLPGCMVPVCFPAGMQGPTPPWRI